MKKETCAIMRKTISFEIFDQKNYSRAFIIILLKIVIFIIILLNSLNSVEYFLQMD